MLDRLTFYDSRARHRPQEIKRHYHTLLRDHYRFLIPKGKRVLELGCGIGDLLAALKPETGVGIDFSPQMIQIARQRHPSLTFIQANAEAFESPEPFDYIILSDLLNDLEDVEELFAKIRTFSTPDTRLILNFFSNLWQPILSTAETSGAKSPTPPQNWLAPPDVLNLLYLSGWEVFNHEPRILFPAYIPGVSYFLNRWCAPLFSTFCLTHYMVCRLRPAGGEARDHTCTVVVPARNEAGNIEAAAQRIPALGKGTEIIFIEGHSRDNTWEEIQRVKAKYPDKNIRALRQQGKGKGNAVREAFQAATGDILFILDADLTVPPEQLQKFYQVARTGLGEFVNGVRLVYPMEDQAMQFANKIANKFFGIAFTWLLNQPVKDTLCGTKVIFRSRYEELARNRGYFGEFDPFGDFDLLFGAAKLNLKIVDLPIRYQARTYGETNIQRWRHGLLLLRMMLFAAKRLKFVA